MGTPRWRESRFRVLAASLAVVIIAASALLGACGDEQPTTPAKPAPAPRPTATAMATTSPTATPTLTLPPAPTVPPVRDTATSSGQAIFQSNCAVCHGAGGEGQPDWHIKKPDGVLPAPPLNGDGHTWHHGDGTLYTYVSGGGKTFESPDIPSFKSGMPAFGETLSREEIIAVIEYVKGLWGDKVAEGLGLKKRESQAIVSETDPYPER